MSVGIVYGKKIIGRLRGMTKIKTLKKKKKRMMKIKKNREISLLSRFETAEILLGADVNEKCARDTARFTVRRRVNGPTAASFHRLAKIRPSGIHFKAANSPLVYLVDEAGVRTNFSESFMRIDRDVTLDVLYKECRHGAMYLDVCNDLLSDIESSASETGTEWRLYDLTVVQENVHGFVRLAGATVRMGRRRRRRSRHPAGADG